MSYCSQCAELMSERDQLKQQLDEARKREAAMREYLAARRRTIESTIASERLAGREDRIPQEQHALAEITAMECAFTFTPTRDFIPRAIADRMADLLEDILTGKAHTPKGLYDLYESAKDALNAYRNAKE